MMNSFDKSALIADLTDRSDDKAEAAALQLAAGGSQSLRIIRDLLTNSSPEVRWWATRSLAEIQAPQAADLLIGSLDDPETSVRQCAAIALRHRPDPKAAPKLIQALNDPDRLMARLAADALISIGEDVVPALIEIMGSDSQPSRLEAVRALAEIGDTRAIPILFGALDEDSALIEFWAGKGLQKMGVDMVFFNT